MTLPREISVTEFAGLRTQVHVLDVRHDWEVALAALSPATVIPLHELPDRLDELPAGSPIACLCHHGVRSLNAAVFLRDHGFDATSVRGGIDAWAQEIDPTIRRY